MSEDSVKQVLVLAPHLLFPVRNGADQYIVRKWTALDSDAFNVIFCTAHGLYARTRDGTWQTMKLQAKDTRRGKYHAVLLMLIGADYHAARFNTPGFISDLLQLSGRNFFAIVVSFPSSVELLDGANISSRYVLLETHNFEPKIYLDRALDSFGARRLLNLLSAFRTYRILRNIPPQIHLITVGEKDAELFSAFGFPSISASSIGYDDLPLRSCFPEYSDPIRIVFVGALSVSMNDTAVRAFISNHLPKLRAAGDRHPIDLHVTGSVPSRSLQRYVRASGVSLHSDLDDHSLRNLVTSCHAMILPFAANNGLKLKVALAASLGIPILTFLPAPSPLDTCEAVVCSSDMTVWFRFLRRISTDAAYMRKLSWDLQASVKSQTWRRLAEESLASAHHGRTHP